MHPFDKIHHVQKLDPNKSLELFSWHAFKENHPDWNYLDLSDLSVGYCNGLPLALVILGSLLHKRDRRIWKSKLDELESSLEPSMEDVFQISFKGLQDNVKEIFLDISCFFVGEDVNCIKDMLKACDLNPDYGIAVLIDLSLVTVEHGKMQMHDFIRQMGRTIVCRESCELEKSRFWEVEEVVNMLKENSGTNEVKAIKLDFFNREPVKIDPRAFRNMKNLRLLIVRRITFSRNIFEWLPNKLKWIECSSFSIGYRTSLPTSFFVNDQLVGLEVQHSSAKHLGKRFENCERLKHVDLSYCTLLTEHPDFSAALILEKLYLRSCKSLKMIHKSIASLSKLITLDFRGCVNLEKLSSNLMLKNLEVLNLSRCIKLQEIPDLSLASNLKNLDLSYCFSLKIIHESIGYLDKLVSLTLDSCYNLEKLPSYLRLSSLDSLSLLDCIKLQQLPEFDENMKSLREMKLDRIAIKELPSSVKHLTGLESLSLRGCRDLIALPHSVYLLKSLKELRLHGCSKLDMFPQILSLNFPQDSLWFKPNRYIKQSSDEMT